MNLEEMGCDCRLHSGGWGLAVDSCKCITNFQIFMWLGISWLLASQEPCDVDCFTVQIIHHWLRKSVIHLLEASPHPPPPVCRESTICNPKFAQHKQQTCGSTGGDVSLTSYLRSKPRVKWVAGNKYIIQ